MGGRQNREPEVIRIAAGLLAFVALLGVGVVSRATGQAMPAATTITISAMQFSPATLSVPSGSTVTWLNQDDRDHTVSSVGGGFTSGNIRPGGSFSHTFTSTGSYTYRCEYHPRMQGTVQVN
jgi:plastocyanin